MSFIDELYTNTQYSVWMPCDLSKRSDAWVSWIDGKTLEVMGDVALVMGKPVRQKISAKEASAILKTSNFGDYFFKISHEAVFNVYISFADYKCHVADRVVNRLSGNPKELDLDKFLKLHELFKAAPLPPADIQKICANQAAVELGRELTVREYSAFAPTDNIGRSYFEHFVDRNNHPLFKDSAKGLWQPDVLSYGNSPDPHLFDPAGEEIQANHPLLGTTFMSKRVTKDTMEIVTGLKALGIPYFYLRDDGFEGSDYWITPLKVFIRPTDYSAYIEKNVVLSHDPKQGGKEVSMDRVVSIQVGLPSNENGILSQTGWLNCFWRALSAEVNRPLRPEEQIKPARAWPGKALTRLQDEVSDIDNALYGLCITLGQIDNQDPALNTGVAKEAQASVIRFAQQEAARLELRRKELETEIARLRGE